MNTFAQHELPDGNSIRMGFVPDNLLMTQEPFDNLWALQPVEPQQIRMSGRMVDIPRRQKAFGHNYQFSGQTAVAGPTPVLLEPYLKWAQAAVDNRLNGLLLNWYAGELRHYIGPHHDDTRQLFHGSPIATISLGERRMFRLTREEKLDGRRTVVDKREFDVEPGSVIILPWKTNLAWKHSVPHFARYHGRRISITLRAFR